MAAFTKRTFAGFGEFWGGLRDTLAAGKHMRGISPAFRERLIMAVTAVNQCRTIIPPTVWREILNRFTDDSETVETLRSHTRTGRPLGSDSFLSKQESAAGCRLRPLPIGRPRGSKKPKKGEERVNINGCLFYYTYLLNEAKVIPVVTGFYHGPVGGMIGLGLGWGQIMTFDGCETS